MKLRIVLATGLLVAACAGVQWELPAVSETSDGLKRPGKFIWHDLISDDTQASQRFYASLFDWQFQSLPLRGADYWIITHAGTAIGGMVNQQQLPAQTDISQWVSVMSVADIDDATRIVKERGGRVLRDPLSLGARGRLAVYADAQGALFAGLETLLGDPIDGGELVPQGSFFWHELWTTDLDQAADFYAALVGLNAEPVGDRDAGAAGVDYRVLRDVAAPRAGLRERPADDVPPLWMPYLRIDSAEELQRILGRVAELGGQVLVPAIERPAGGMVAVIAGPSGAPLALQTWSRSNQEATERNAAP